MLIVIVSFPSRGINQLVKASFSVALINCRPPEIIFAKYPLSFSSLPVAPLPLHPTNQLSFAIVWSARSQSNGTKMVPVYTKLRSVITVNLVSLTNQLYQLKISSTKIGTDYECTNLIMVPNQWHSKLNQCYRLRSQLNCYVQFQKL
jgi:hypothetical protein